jgi:hypothetical protein
MSDTVIARHEIVDVSGRGRVNLLHFHRGMVLMVASSAVGLYRDRDAVEDPLGNGLIGFEPIPESLQAEPDPEHAQVLKQTSGFVGLCSGAVLFVRPDGIALYANGQDALHNRERFWLIPFESSETATTH